MAPGLTPGAPGFWGPPTSTLDWCEANYALTPYIAEFWNSVSNLCFIIPPFAVCARLWGRGVEKVYLLSLLYLGLTGIGSLAFHMTLKYPMQLWDELSMVWSVLFVLFLILKILKTPQQVSVFKFLLILYGVFVTCSYLLLVNPLIFQVLYAILHYTVLYQAYLMSKTCPCDSRLFYVTLFAHHLGFTLWNIDNMFCGQLEYIRSVVPQVVAPLTQLHACWHLLAGYGSFVLILFCIHSRQLTLKRRCVVSSDSLSGLTLSPDVKQKRGAPDNNNEECVYIRHAP